MADRSSALSAAPEVGQDRPGRQRVEVGLRMRGNKAEARKERFDSGDRIDFPDGGAEGDCHGPHRARGLDEQQRL